MNDNAEKQMADRLLMHEIEIGLDSEALINSSLGKSIVKKALADEREAVIALLNVDPNDAKEIARLQQLAFVPRKALMWLDELMVAGRNAEKILDETGE